MSNIESPKFNEPNREKNHSPNGAEKELSPDQYSILIEKDVIEKYISEIQKTNSPLSKTEIEIRWIHDYGVRYRDFFNQHQEELIGRYKKDPQGTIEYIKTEIEKNL